MRSVCTKLSDSEYEKLKELAARRGKTIYELLRDLILRELANEGLLNEAPIEVRLGMLEEKFRELQERLVALEKEVEELKKKPAGLMSFKR